MFTKNSGVDHITDFERGLDKIDLTAFGTGAWGHGLFGEDGVLGRGQIVGNDVYHVQMMDWDDRVFLDTASNTLYEARYIHDVYADTWTLELGPAILTVEPGDLTVLTTNDFLIA